MLLKKPRSSLRRSLRRRDDRFSGRQRQTRTLTWHMPLSTLREDGHRQGHMLRRGKRTGGAPLWSVSWIGVRAEVGVGLKRSTTHGGTPYQFPVVEIHQIGCRWSEIVFPNGAEIMQIAGAGVPAYLVDSGIHFGASQCFCRVDRCMGPSCVIPRGTRGLLSQELITSPIRVVRVWCSRAPDLVDASQRPLSGIEQKLTILRPSPMSGRSSTSTRAPLRLGCPRGSRGSRRWEHFQVGSGPDPREQTRE